VHFLFGEDGRGGENGLKAPPSVPLVPEGRHRSAPSIAESGWNSSIYIGPHVSGGMANMATCACGWTIISPVGAEDVKKHILIHLSDTHPGTKVTGEEIKTMIKAI